MARAMVEIPYFSPRNRVRWLWYEAQGTNPIFEDEYIRCSLCGWLQPADGEYLIVALFNPEKNKAGQDPIDKICRWHRSEYGEKVWDCLTGCEVELLPELSKLQILSHEVWFWGRTMCRFVVYLPREILHFFIYEAFRLSRKWMKSIQEKESGKGY